MWKQNNFYAIKHRFGYSDRSSSIYFSFSVVPVSYGLSAIQCPHPLCGPIAYQSFQWTFSSWIHFKYIVHCIWYNCKLLSPYPHFFLFHCIRFLFRFQVLDKNCYSKHALFPCTNIIKWQAEYFWASQKSQSHDCDEQAQYQ